MNAMRLILALLLPIIAGCASHTPAPVEDRRDAPAAAKPAAPTAPAATDFRVAYPTVERDVFDAWPRSGVLSQGIGRLGTDVLIKTALAFAGRDHIP